ncbi:MAG: di-trans,poly-cis-decaprenylcistransferase [Chloroflexi bacterium]|nr:di-trans,poly-cis-decaprenylcistransferase [Chloroflexota bacterium]
MPAHVAIIMDGNGRWAEARQQPRTEGHVAGLENIRRVLRHLENRGVSYATIFAFSTENWTRPQGEVSFLLELLAESLKTEVGDLHENNVRILHQGRLAELPPELSKEIAAAVELTSKNDGITLIVAFNYGGRAEIVDAAKRLIESGVSADKLDEESFAREMSPPGVPDPDLVVRTSGEFRISNFLLWQSAYSEFYSTPAPWPEFDEAEVDKAIEAFSNRKRKFGGILADRPE